jgi:hypothetical protein
MNMGIMDAIVLAKSIASGDLERYAKQRHADASDWVRLNRRISTIALDSTVTTTQTLVSGQSILVDGSGTNTGSIIVSPISAISVPNATSAGAITNSGSISGASFGIYASSSTLWMVTPGSPRIDSIGDIGFTSIKNISSQKQI